ncbi:tautomerase family protein [Paraburkholderia strydomiana]|uniref:tautomerase family protein n=1 Tax=Paraburkholderia strydomiana TaxID=1245417 RepID=UPI00285BECF3|nr:tautomerase family protein [Paraburkholderia strydomiana]MDR7004031.1 4-oxalocrotonate tautomerase [Paraburkholderia strydomiana]
MPIIHISLVEGRDAQAVKACLKAIARTVHETLGVPLESIRVFANEVPSTHWAIGERTKDELGSPALENGK